MFWRLNQQVLTERYGRYQMDVQHNSANKFRLLFAI